MLLTSFLLLATVLNTATAATCTNGTVVEANIKYECFANDSLNAIGCESDDGDFLNFGEHFQDTHYQYLCYKVGAQVTYFPKSCVFGESAPANPTIVERGQEAKISPSLLAICHDNDDGTITKETKVLDLSCDWGSQHYNSEQTFTRSDISNAYQFLGSFECIEGEIVQLYCVTHLPEGDSVSVNTVGTANGSVVLCQESPDLVDGVTVYLLEKLEVADYSDCEHDGVTYQLSAEWESADGKTWWSCELNVTTNETYIATGCIGVPRDLALVFFNDPTTLPKYHYSAGDLFKNTTYYSLFMCAPDGSSIDIFDNVPDCVDAGGTTTRWTFKFRVATTVFICTEKLVQYPNGTYYVDTELAVWGCNARTGFGRGVRQLGLIVNGTECAQIAEDETTWVLLVDIVYNPTTIAVDIFQDITTVAPTPTEQPLDSNCTDENDVMCAALASFCTVDAQNNPTEYKIGILTGLHPDNTGNQSQSQETVCESCRQGVGSVMKSIDALCRKTCDPNC